MDQTGDLMQEKIQHLPRVIVARQSQTSTWCRVETVEILAN